MEKTIVMTEEMKVGINNVIDKLKEYREGTITPEEFIAYLDQQEEDETQALFTMFAAARVLENMSNTIFMMNTLGQEKVEMDLVSEVMRVISIFMSVFVGYHADKQAAGKLPVAFLPTEFLPTEN